MLRKRYENGIYEREKMNKKLELPVAKSIPIESYNCHCIFLSVLFNSESYYKKFYEDYANICFYDIYMDFCLNIWYIRDSDVFELITADHEGTIIENVYKLCSRYIKKNDSFVESVIKMLNMGYYFYGVINEFYVPCRSATRKKYFLHDFLVNGYDINEKCFIIYGYGERKIYQKTTISFEDFEKGIKSVHQGEELLCFFKMKENVTYNFDLKRVYNNMLDYLHSCNTTCNAEVNEKDSKIYGINVYTKLYNELKGNTEYLDLRWFRILWEHKKCMKERISLLKSYGVKIVREVEKEYSRIVDNHEILFRMAIKYTITRDVKLLTSICDSLLKNKVEEEELLYDIVAELKRKIM